MYLIIKINAIQILYLIIMKPSIASLKLFASNIQKQKFFCKMNLFLNLLFSALLNQLNNIFFIYILPLEFIYCCFFFLMAFSI